VNVSDAIPEYEIVAPNEALISWKHDQVSIQIRAIVQAEILLSRTRAASPEILGENVVQNAARAVGYVEGLTFLEDLLMLRDVVDTKEDKDDADKREEGSKPVR
jgi:hypothetical protein